jgi:hypothetical protein
LIAAISSGVEANAPIAAVTARWNASTALTASGCVLRPVQTPPVAGRRSSNPAMSRSSACISSSRR